MRPRRRTAGGFPGSGIARRLSVYSCRLLLRVLDDHRLQAVDVIGQAVEFVGKRQQLAPAAVIEMQAAGEPGDKTAPLYVIVPFFDAEMKRSRRRGETFDAIATRIALALPAKVYVSFDIDGLDPTLCPHTGTPVPGGLSFDEAIAVVEAVARFAQRIPETAA